jgi:hypothetical protein
MPERRDPPPWSVEELDACFIVKDSSGQKLGYFYYEEEPGRRTVAKLLTKDEARRIAVNVAKAAGAGGKELARGDKTAKPSALSATGGSALRPPAVPSLGMGHSRQTAIVRGCRTGGRRRNLSRP